MLLGCIGDDFTGSSDLGNTLTKAGMRTVQYVGVPASNAGPDVEAGVVALKSRSIPVDEAIKLSLEALDWLLAQGCEQILFKYCSTFDSTPEGNIGPVAEALADRLEARKVLVCPAFPATGRTIFEGHLFVGDKLLSESGMENHPLTPMTDPDLRRWLGLQSKGSVGHLPASAIWQGTAVAAERLDSEDAAGHRLVVADAVRDEDLLVLGKIADGLPLITGGSGIALGLPGNFRARGLLFDTASQWHGQAGKVAVLSGSCSTATRRQVARHSEHHPTHEITAEQVMSDALAAQDLADWAEAQEGIPLIYSSADPSVVRAAQERYEKDTVATKFENLFAETAKALVAKGITRLISAGGETSGAVVEALSVQAMEIGPEIDPGVPAMRAGENLVLVLKSGNFGADDFFEKAANRLERDA